MQQTSGYRKQYTRCHSKVVGLKHCRYQAYNLLHRQYFQMTSKSKYHVVPPRATVETTVLSRKWIWDSVWSMNNNDTSQWRHCLAFSSAYIYRWVLFSCLLIPFSKLSAAYGAFIEKCMLQAYVDTTALQPWSSSFTKYLVSMPIMFTTNSWSCLLHLKLMVYKVSYTEFGDRFSLAVQGLVLSVHRSMIPRWKSRPTHEREGRLASRSIFRPCVVTISIPCAEGVRHQSEVICDCTLQQEAFEKCRAHSPLRAAARRIAIHQVSLLSHAACASMSTTTTTTTPTTTRDRGDRYNQ